MENAEGMGQEADVSVYDALHATVEQDDGAKGRAVYAGLFQAMLGLIARRGVTSVLEVGCGTGLFAELMINQTGVAYRGFDVSPTGVAYAQARLPKAALFVGDALSPESYRGAFDCIVCSEVLEHIPGDRDAVALWPRGTFCVCSVPNFDYPTHVRVFRTEQAVRERYGDALDIQTITRIPASARAGRPFAEYARRLLWARYQPRKMLGMLGVNAFDWHAGWFVFAGVRR